MKAIRWILLGALLAAFVLFAIPNWDPFTKTPFDAAAGLIPVNLGFAIIDFRLPILLLLAFLLGWLPTLLMHWTARAAWRRRTAKVDRMLEAAQSAGPRSAAVETAVSPYPVQAQPMIVPPGA